MNNSEQKKIPMPQAAPDIRNKNFSEVALGYTEEEAIAEASRCLNCKNHPCMNGCPVSVSIPKFIAFAARGDFESAYEIIKDSNALPGICGRVCPQENQCEGNCIRGLKGESIGIGYLERFCADWNRKNSTEKEKRPINENNSKKVAVIGSGPSGLSCAGALAKKGYSVTIFEAFHKAGGVLVYGIPEFRLPKDIVEHEIKNLTELGVEIKLNSVIGKIFTIDELFEEGYSAVFIGSGAGLPAFLGIKGENASGVYSANEYLTRINLMKAYLPTSDTPIIKSKNIAVVGGGNVAMDAARCAKRLGAENVYIIYRRSEAEMPARHEEILHAKEEGIIFNILCNPTEITTDENGKVKSMICERMVLGEVDARGRRSPVPTGEHFELELDTVIIAIGTNPNPLLKKTTSGLDFDERGRILTENGVKTSKEGVFAGGDAVTGAATVILAMGAGKKAAEEIDTYIQSKN